MGEIQVPITVEERQYLLELLNAVLKETRVEEHRTRAPSYREHVEQRELLILSLLSKLGQLTA